MMAEQDKLIRLEDTIERQKDFIPQVPDPDNRERAEENLITLIGMRDAILESPELRNGEED